MRKEENCKAIARFIRNILTQKATKIVVILNGKSDEGLVKRVCAKEEDEIETGSEVLTLIFKLYLEGSLLVNCTLKILCWCVLGRHGPKRG